jgi:hypothetical protein
MWAVESSTSLLGRQGGGRASTADVRDVVDDVIDRRLMGPDFNASVTIFRCVCSTPATLQLRTKLSATGQLTRETVAESTTTFRVATASPSGDHPLRLTTRSIPRARQSRSTPWPWWPGRRQADGIGTARSSSMSRTSPSTHASNITRPFSSVARSGAPMTPDCVSSCVFQCTDSGPRRKRS